MKWLRTLVLFDKGDVLGSTDWADIHASYVRAIESVEFPEGSGSLTLRRKIRLGRQWQRNGVGYPKSCFVRHLVQKEGWLPEATVNIKPPATEVILYPSLANHQEEVVSAFGGFDFFHTAKNGTVAAIEWETGNISSSHRSMNKLAIALESEQIQIAVLIVPSRLLYEHLTDRIGNIAELSGYLAMWKAMGASVTRGLFAVSVVEHDALTDDPAFPFLPVGNDGRAEEGRRGKSKS
jgi:hypothetical protein